jgi:hypothetical protein
MDIYLINPQIMAYKTAVMTIIYAKCVFFATLKRCVLILSSFASSLAVGLMRHSSAATAKPSAASGTEKSIAI